MTPSSTLCISWLLQLLLIFWHSQQCESSLTFGITQWGDVRGMLEPMQADNLPTPGCKDAKNCVGGIPLLMGYIRELRLANQEKRLATYSIATGNLVSRESGYLSLLGWIAYAKFLEVIYHSHNGVPQTTTEYRPHFMSLGTEEFEGGIFETNRYLFNCLQVGRVVTNVACRPDGETRPPAFCDFTSRSSILPLKEVGSDVNIGVVGFVDPIVNSIINFYGSEVFNFTDPAISIAEEIEKNLRDAEFVIAVGTGDLQMAKSIIDIAGSKVKLVLFGGDTTDLTGSYPLKYKDSYIATTGSKYGTKIGSLDLTVDGVTGALVNISGELLDVRMSDGVIQDGVAFNHFQSLIYSAGYQPLSRTVGKLAANPLISPFEESNVGNLVTDAVVHCAYNFYIDQTLVGPLIGLWDTRSLSTNQVEAGRDIKVIDVHKMFSTFNYAYLLRMRGSTVRKLFDTSAQSLEDPFHGSNSFKCGVEVSYYRNNQTVATLRMIQMDANGYLKMGDVTDEKMYQVVIPSFMYRRKGPWDYLPTELFPVNRDYKVVDGAAVDVGYNVGKDSECVINYIKGAGAAMSIGVEDRIIIR